MGMWASEAVWGAAHLDAPYIIRRVRVCNKNVVRSESREPENLRERSSTEGFYGTRVIAISQAE